MPERTSITGRYTRSLAAAAVAVATLLLAANTGPARAVEHRPAPRLSDALVREQPARTAPTAASAV